ncbi:hypothetical protein Barb4_00390 [Bacteroidales bacterium Barb4]|nr:hypothetical protein Barb4_00390 [Bacteroidales bacterium Barb4]
MQRSGMWGLRQVYINKVLKERYKQQTMVYNAIYYSVILSGYPGGVVLIPPHLPPHSATLHVGLKSLAPSGLLCRIGTIVLGELSTLCVQSRFVA